MAIICSIKAFIYCADHNPSARVLPCLIDEDWQGCWSDLQTLLEANKVPVFLVSADEVRQQGFPTAPKFEIAGSARTREQLSGLLSVESIANTTSVLIAGWYAETLITDVALVALEKGYDTFVIWDRVWAISETGLEAAKARLLQAGAVPTSVDQVLHRWG